MVVEELNFNVVVNLNRVLINVNLGDDKNEMVLLMMFFSMNWVEFLIFVLLFIVLLG